MILKVIVTAAVLLAATLWPVLASKSKVLLGRWVTWLGITVAFGVASLFGKPGFSILFLAIGFVVWLEGGVLQEDALEIKRQKAFVVFAYRGLAAGMAVLLALESWVAGAELIAPLVFVIALFDIGGWVGGKWLTRFAPLDRRLFPTVSPNKTLGGLVGSLVLGFAADIWIGGFGLGAYLVIALFAVAGDWLESWVKRVVGVKDASDWLPGFGGLMDRVDSLLPMGLVLLIIGFYPSTGA
jgi:CDP-diglyceride synthetase